MSFYILRKISNFFMKILYNPKIIHENNMKIDAPYIIACNHVFIFDPLVILFAFNKNISFLAKKELSFFPFKWFFKASKCVLVDRNNKNDLECVNKILSNGECVGIFPEGTRNRTKELLPFRYGAVSLAIKNDVKIIPCYINGHYNIFKRNLKIVIGKPITLRYMDNKMANKLLKTRIERLRKEA